jgi:hypothetical protein
MIRNLFIPESKVNRKEIIRQIRDESLRGRFTESRWFSEQKRKGGTQRICPNPVQCSILFLKL